MDASIVVATITGICSVLAVILSNISSNRKIEHTLDKAQAVTDTKIDELTREVREHNNFAQRVPILEEKINVANHRISDLERRVENVK